MKSEKDQIVEYKKWLKIPHNNKENRISIINYLINKYNYKKYLEIGISKGECFKQINIEYKDGVDPSLNQYVNFNMTSNEFFEKIDKNYKYDIIFIDGLHHDYQVYNDIINSLNHLSDNGIILCHDMNPPFEICQRKKSIVNTWNGDCWKAFVKLRSENEELEMFTIDIDFGIGFIRKGIQECIQLPMELNYAYYENNKKNIMNLITIDNFYSKFQ